MLEIFLKEKVKMDSSLKKNPTRGVIYQWLLIFIV